MSTIKYANQDYKVLKVPSDEYADEGIENIEDTKMLQVNLLD